MPVAAPAVIELAPIELAPEPEPEPSFELPVTLAEPSAPMTFAAPTPQRTPALAPQPFVAPPPVAQPPRVYVANDPGDLLFDGAARSRRARWVVIGVALVALLGTIAAAIASHYRPM